MLQPYHDILNAMTESLRGMHDRTGPDEADYPNGCVGGTGSPEQCNCVAQPLWWDQNGVPRFAAHHPSLCPVIYATEVALLRISCQSCGRDFRVQMSARLGTMLLSSSLQPDVVTKNPPHYGDPPYHANCRTGVTMNCWDLRVLEFWTRANVSGVEPWTRVPELEISLPDETAPDRVDPGAP